MAYTSEIKTALHGTPSVANIVVNNKTVGSIVGLYYLMNLWKAFQVSKIDKSAKGGKQDTFWTTVGGMLFPGWYSSFKIGKHVPNGNSFSHTLGQIIFPSMYTSWQFAKLREQMLPQTSNGTFEKGLALMAAIPYGAYASTTLANQAPKLFPPKQAPRQGLYLVSAAPQAILPQGFPPAQLLMQPSSPIMMQPQQSAMLTQPLSYTASPFRMNY